MSAAPAEFADQLAAKPDTGRLPDLNRLRAHFTPDPAHVPNVEMHLAPQPLDECLIGEPRSRCRMSTAITTADTAGLNLVAQRAAAARDQGVLWSHSPSSPTKKAGRRQLPRYR